MESKLKIKTIYPKSSKDIVLIVKILDQPESFRRTGSGIKSFKASNEFEILSYEHPSICRNCLWVMGSQLDQDERCLTLKFDSENDRDKFVNRLIDAINEFNEKYMI